LSQTDAWPFNGRIADRIAPVSRRAVGGLTHHFGRRPISAVKGDRKSQWAMTVNERWRVCFEFRKGDAFNVEIVDYHRG
jgi:hypothetical protein